MPTKRCFPGFGCLVGVVAAVVVLAGCQTAADPAWTALIEGGRGLENFERIGDANWRAEEGAIVADAGSGYLVSKQSYRDFILTARFWADAGTNSGIFLRVTAPARIDPDSSYEVNIFDGRPDPSYGTGAIVGFARVDPMPRAGGRWNDYEIRAEGNLLTVTLNGVVTAQIRDARFPAGPIALQFGPGADGKPGGAIKWRRLLVQPL